MSVTVLENVAQPTSLSQTTSMSLTTRQQNANIFTAPLNWFFERLYKISVQELRGQGVEDAKSLLYQVYHEEQKWTPLPGNPSGMCIRNKKFEDSLPLEADWVGVYSLQNNTRTLVGTCRFVHGLEFTRYLDTDQLSKVKGVSNAGELNRLAIRKSARSGIVLPLLMYSIFLLAHSKGYNQVVGATSKRIANRFISFLGTLPILKFQYDRSDKPVYLVCTTNNTFKFWNIVLQGIRLVLVTLRKTFWQYFPSE